MLKKILLSTILVAMTFMSFAQVFSKGSMNVCVGYGYNAFSHYITDSWSDNTGFSSSNLGQIHLKYEYMVSDKVGIGLSLNYMSYKVGYNTDMNGTYKASIQYSSISSLFRTNVYYVNTDKIGIYTGIGLGYRTAVFKEKYEDPNFQGESKTPNLFPFGMEITTGIKGMFTPNIGAYAEVGFAKSVIQAGICIGFGGGEGGGGGGGHRGGGRRQM